MKAVVGAFSVITNLRMELFEALFKVPKHITFVTEFPTTVTGKIQKFVMKEVMERQLKEKNG